MIQSSHDHACDRTIISFAINLFCSIKDIPIKGLINGTYRKADLQLAQPDVSYYIGAQTDLISWGTKIIDLQKYSPPNLVIEIADTFLADAKGDKRLLYEDLKVKEYWIIDVKNVEIIAFSIINKGSVRITNSQVLPGLSIPLLEEALERSRYTDQAHVGAWLLRKFQQ